MLLTGTVPVNDFLLRGTVPVVPANNFLLTRAVPVNNFSLTDFNDSFIDSFKT